MNLPNDRDANLDSAYYPTHAPDLLDQYLDVTLSSYPSFDYDEDMQEKSSIATGPDPQWFTDFILYDSDDPNTNTDSSSVSETSGSFLVGSTDGIATTPLFYFPTIPVLELNDPVVPDTTGFNQFVHPSTGIDDEDLTAVLTSDQLHDVGKTAGLASENFPSYDSESVSREESIQSSPDYSIITQNDTTERVSIPRTRHYECPTCQRIYSSEYRLSEHLRKHHQLRRFSCSTCGRRFEEARMLMRHQTTHQPDQPLFACLCPKRYARRDGLLRHLRKMAEKPEEAGRHEAVESNMIRDTEDH